MSTLKAFLQPTVAGRTKEVILSERFKEKDGTVVPFVIQAISQEENDRLCQQSQKREIVKGQQIERLDRSLYTRRLILACVKEPDLKDKEICDYYGVIDPLEVAGKMLSVGEYGILVDAIMGLNGVNDAQEKLEEAKNS